MSRKYYAGDSFPLSIAIQTDGDPQAIPSGASVKAALISSRGVKLAGPWTIASGAGNWPLGIVTVTVPGADTKDLRAQPCRMEIQIESNGESVTRQSSETISILRAAITSSV